MTNLSLDFLARRVGATRTRRAALKQAAGGLAVALGLARGVVPSAEAKPKPCKKNQQKCAGKCISKSKCCTDKDCTGADAGACVKNKCKPAFRTCKGGDATVAFVNAPGSAPGSDGAVRFTVGPDPAVDDWAHLRNADFAGKRIADLTTLTYSVYMTPLVDATCPEFNPYIALYALAGADPHVLVSTSVRSPLSCNTWQTINAASGEWWMPTATDFAPQNDPKTLAEIAAHFPGIAVRNATTTDAQCSQALGGLRLEAGEWPGGGGTGDAVMYVSYLRVGFGSSPVTYRF